MSEGRMCGHKAHIDPLEQCADTIDPRPRSPYLLSKLEPLKCWLICHNSDAAPPSLRGDQAQASPLRQPDDPQLPMATDQQLPEQTDNSALFRPLTPASIAAQRANAGQHNVDKDEPAYEDEGPVPDPLLEQGSTLPGYLKNQFQKNFISAPLEEIDDYYATKETFIVVNKSHDLYRFTSTNALWILSPFNVIRRVNIAVSIHPLFTLFIIATILVNCVFMMMPTTETTETSEIVFATIYTIEFVIKVLARGFILKRFTYLRDPWNWLDFIILILAYVTMVVDVGSVSALRTFRVLRALRTVAIIPGMKTIVAAIFESARAMRNVIIHALFCLVVFSLIGLQVYMGTLTQRCMMLSPEENVWEIDNNDKYLCKSEDGRSLNDQECMCGNSSGAGYCPKGRVCAQGFAENPNYGYTNFDNFGWSLLSTFRTMTLDFWEDLYHMIIRTNGPWHILFFIGVLFLGSFFVVTLILAIVAISYNDLQKRIEEEKKTAERLNKSSNEQYGDIPFIDHVQNESGEMKDAMQLKEVISDEGSQKHIGDGETKSSAAKACKNGCDRCCNFCCIWNCCQPWIKFRDLLAKFVLHPFFELFILLCIILNTTCLSVDHHDMTKDMEITLSTGNYVFTLIFFFEAILKIIALSPKFYFKESWNRFDFSIVVLAILELGLEGIQGLSVLRSFRLLRIFRLAKSWPKMNQLLVAMAQTLRALGSLIMVLCIVIFIFAVVGMQLFGTKYTIDEEIPRWNFTDFMHSFMLVFRILCGEWIETMWDCIHVADWSCVPFYLAAVIIGDLVVVNLVVALVLSNFGHVAQGSEENETTNSKVSEALGKLASISNAVKVRLARLLQIRLASDNQEAENPPVVTYPPDCCPNPYYRCFPFIAGNKNDAFWQKWHNIRLQFCHLIEKKYFNTIAIVILVATSIPPTLEDVNLPTRPILLQVISVMDKIFTFAFLTEISFKLIGLGLKSYFSSLWNIFDYIIVLFSLIDTIGEWTGVQDQTFFEVIHVLRTFRLLMIVSRWRRLKNVVNVMSRALPSIFNVSLVCFIFWLIFAIIGVQLFAGKFFKCVDGEGKIQNHTITPNRTICYDMNYSWENSEMNFDHVGNSFLCLLQVATFKGWIGIMADAVDSREVDIQPIREINIYMYLYFVIFVIIGGLFTLNLFAGVIYNNLNEHKIKMRNPLELLMTEDQRQYYKAMKKMVEIKPPSTVPRPHASFQQSFYNLVLNKKFDMVIMLVISLDMISMMTDSYNQAENYSYILDYLNLLFVIIYFIEFICKIIGLRHYYFKDPWNVFDFIVVFLNVLSIFLMDLIAKYFISPILLRIVRVAKVVRVLRLIRGAKVIRKMALAITRSIPILYTYCILLFLVIFVYATIGMLCFKQIINIKPLNDVYNFQTIGQSIIIMFQMSTAAGWDSVFAAISSTKQCQDNEIDGDCNNFFIALIFLLSFLLLSFLININMYISVIMEIYDQATEVITNDDFELFYEIWAKFSKDNNSQYIKFDDLSEFLDSLKPPLGIPKPNNYKIVSLSIPVSKNDLVSCSDVLDAITRDFFVRKGRCPTSIPDVKSKNEVEENTERETTVPWTKSNPDQKTESA